MVKQKSKIFEAFKKIMLMYLDESSAKNFNKNVISKIALKDKWSDEGVSFRFTFNLWEYIIDLW
jgi:hypothetical protein